MANKSKAKGSAYEQKIATRLTSEFGKELDIGNQPTFYHKYKKL